jgi:anti-sigma factor ChrR (cupin superfamily)
VAPVEDSSWTKVAPWHFLQTALRRRSNDRVSMLVQLDPRTDYPPHEHAGVEELHLLEGELWIDDRKLLAGDYNRAEAGTADRRVWSETGCTCVLTTSTRDRLSAATFT